MQHTERTTLVAPCGIDCGICELYTCRYNQQLYAHLLSRGIPKERIPCNGCRSIQGNCPVIPSTCDTYLCVKEKDVQFCYECNEFPCVRLHPSADRADVLPHNLKVYNLCTIRQKGIEKFIEGSSGTKQTYYKGKMKVGSGPLLAE